jgi:hypothetical protein
MAHVAGTYRIRVLAPPGGGGELGLGVVGGDDCLLIGVGDWEYHLMAKFWMKWKTWRGDLRLNYLLRISILTLS